ncbi:MAG: NAD(P)H-dependent oxidoreductase subunit E [Chloroflexi bacterium]|nr:NAD(P)H-dependent oxidoreductase subunit E [Chloroflexota bacterium]
MNKIAEKYTDEIQNILAKYPPEEKRSAVMALLYIAQREDGYVSKDDLKEIAEILEMSPTEVVSLVGFYSLYHDEQAGKYRIQVCTDLPCALRGADQFLTDLCENIGIKVGETTPDGLVTIEEVKCLAACDKAPMFQVQSGEGLEYHELQSVESTMALIDSWKKKESK